MLKAKTCKGHKNDGRTIQVRNIHHIILYDGVIIDYYTVAIALFRLKQIYMGIAMGKGGGVSGFWILYNIEIHI